jgi:hypothetical protein
MEAGSSSTSNTSNRTQNAANQLALRHRHEMAAARQQHTLATEGQTPVEQLMGNLVPLAEHPGVPAYLANAERDLRLAAEALRPSAETVSPQNTLRQFSRALEKYNTQAANFLHQAASNGQAVTDPSMKGFGANVVAAVGANLGFSIPAAIYAGTKTTALAHSVSPSGANALAESAFAVSVGLMNAFTNLNADKIKHAQGGTTATLHIGSPNSSSVGPYKKIGTNLAITMGSTAVYALARAGMVSRVPEPEVSVAGGASSAATAFAIAAASAVTAGVVREGLLNLAAHRTIKGNNANVAAELPLTNHNRSFATGQFGTLGVTLNEVKNPMSNLTVLGGTKLKAFMVNFAAALTGMVGLAATGLAMRDADPNSFKEQSEKVMASFAAFFVLASAVQVIATALKMHPGANAPSFTRSSEEILVRELQASSLNELDQGLGELARMIQRAPANDPIRQNFELAAAAFGGEPLRADGGDQFQQMATLLDGLAKPFIHTQVHTGVIDPATREDREMAQALTGAARSFRAAHDFLHPDQAFADHVLPTSVPETFLIDAQRKLYDALAVVVGTTHVDTIDPANAGALPTQATLQKFAPLMPIFAAMRHEEMRPNFSSLMHDLSEVRPNDHPNNKRLGGMLPSTDPASLRLHDKLADGGRLGIPVKDFMLHALRREPGESIQNTLQTAMQNIKKPDAHAKARATLMMNIARQGVGVDPVVANLPARQVGDLPARARPNAPNDQQISQPDYAGALVRSLRDYLGSVEIEIDARLKDLVTEVETGRVHAKAMAQALHQTMLEMDAAVENGTGRFTSADLRRAIGPVAVDLLLDTYPQGDPAALTAEGLAQRVLADIGSALAHMDGDQKALFDAASKLNRVFDKAPLENIPQRDAHYHPSNYNGLVNSLILLTDHMQANGIEHTNAAGIPSQLVHRTDVTQYYAGVTGDTKPMQFMKTILNLPTQDQHMGLRYRSHDEVLASEYQSTLPRPGAQGPELAQRRAVDLSGMIGMSITGYDVTDGRSISDALDHKMRSFPGVFKSGGEVTLVKEVVSKLQEETPKIDSAATMDLFHAHSERGLPLVLHCDRGTPHSKNKYADQVIGMIKDWVRQVHGQNTVHRPDELADKMRQADGTLPADFPERQVKVCWAHAAGVSRFTAESPEHTRELDRLLSEPELQGHLFVDLSWDFIGHDILQNTEDLLLKSAQTPQEKEGMAQIAKALDAMIKSYKDFAQVGGQSDKAQDLGDLKLSAVHRLTGSRIAQHHLNQVATFKTTLSDVISQNPAVAQRMLDLVENHGDHGNNWLNLLFRHSDKVMFGTDALAIGTKAHGEAAYAINTKTLYPLYHIFQVLANNVAANEPARADGPTIADADAMEGQIPPFALQLNAVVENVARRTYNNFFQSDDMTRRRNLHEEMLQESGPDFTAGPPITSRLHPNGDLLGAAHRHAAAQAASSDVQPNPSLAGLTRRADRSGQPSTSAQGGDQAAAGQTQSLVAYLAAQTARNASRAAQGPSTSAQPGGPVAEGVERAGLSATDLAATPPRRGRTANRVVFTTNDPARANPEYGRGLLRTKDGTISKDTACC